MTPSIGMFVRRVGLFGRYKVVGIDKGRQTVRLKGPGIKDARVTVGLESFGLDYSLAPSARA